MTACSSQGAVSKLAIGGYQMPFSRIDDQSVRNLVDDNDDIITGLMDPIEERVSLGLQQLTLNVRLHPTPLELTQLLPLMGMTLDTGVWQLDEFPASFAVIVDRVAKVHTYATCYINQFTLRGQTGQPITLDLQIFGTTFSEGNAGSFSATALQTDAPYPFTAGVFTAKSSTRLFDRFAWSTSHYLERQYENALTPGCIDMTRRRSTLATSVPYVSTNVALFSQPFITATDGAAASLVFTRGGQSTAIAFQNLTPIATPPSIPGKTQIRLPLFYRVYRSISTKAFTVTHDDTV